MKDEGGRMKAKRTGRKGETGKGGKKPKRAKTERDLPRAQLLTISSNRRPITPSPRVPVSASSFILHPSKRLGQHFLTDQRVIDRIIKSLDPKPDETIVEIGPGRGALTKSLVSKAGRVIAFEFDRNLIPLLTEQFGSVANFKLVQRDALVADFCSEIMPATRARLVANLPYNISTAILQRLIEQRHCLSEMVLMLQREVVDRIMAAPGSTDRGYLSVFVEAYCETQRLFDVAPGAFRPAPKVWSTVIRVTPRRSFASPITDQNRLVGTLPVTDDSSSRILLPIKDEVLLWEVVSAGFAQRRKTILNNLRSARSLQEIIKKHGGASIVLCQAGIDLTRRGETLTLEEWLRIAQLLA
ncbi:MAG TPA: 16S rRNA (adenine(1518)-N(6)/adenine(1519)-N(6))-dimethyltransferase RsmA [Pyrinomonadaceae bacterium]|nr:16S rRNA (adenine(1518)-N(6)/adenine(1519)-N(6))-dimethyltransferase RsmA [Pyrinomonadaceae bacterium]